jgi:nucleoid-associated protein YgaU
MSAATEFAPVVFIPERAREHDRRPLADVVELYRPDPDSAAPPLRLTRRGVVASGVAVAVAAIGLVWLAWSSAPGTATHAPRVPATVTVQSGDTLWSIAGRVAPGRDPRDEVVRLQRINHLDGVGLAAGQVLRTS